MIFFVAKEIFIRELFSYINLEEFPSGQRGQTVNLLSSISMVRIHLPPPILWEHSSAGRASALQAEGHRFDPCCSHHYNLILCIISSVGRAPDYEPVGRRFESYPSHHSRGKYAGKLLFPT